MPYDEKQSRINRTP